MVGAPATVRMAGWTAPIGEPAEITFAGRAARDWLVIGPVATVGAEPMIVRGWAADTMVGDAVPMVRGAPTIEPDWMVVGAPCIVAPV